MRAATKDDINQFAEAIWPDYDIDVGPVENYPEVGGVPTHITRYAVVVRDHDGHDVDTVTADTMDELRELLEQKLNRG
jgi:hypothetical protein